MDHDRDCLAQEHVFHTCMEVRRAIADRTEQTLKALDERDRLREQLHLVTKMNSDNAKMRTEYMKERDVALLQNGEWEKLVRAAADQIYALGKQLRAVDLATGQTLQILSTEMHRECQIIKGEDPLPHAGERISEKRNKEPRFCGLPKHMTDQPCERELPCSDHGGPVQS